MGVSLDFPLGNKVEWGKRGVSRRGSLLGFLGKRVFRVGLGLFLGLLGLAKGFLSTSFLEGLGVAEEEISLSRARFRSISLCSFAQETIQSLNSRYDLTRIGVVVSFGLLISRRDFTKAGCFVPIRI